MKRTILVLGTMLALIAALAGCGGADTSSEATSSSDGVTLNDDYPEALSVPAQLSIGTLMLEDTDNAVTEEQAQELLTPWQLLRSLQESGTAAEIEIDAIVNQIHGAMTTEQLTAIKEMELTPTSMLELARERGGFGGFGGGGGFRLPAGVTPGRGRGPGGGFGGGGNLSPEEQEAAIAERMSTLAGSFATNFVVTLLEARAEGEALEAAAPPSGAFGSMRAILGAVTEATGLDQQALMTQVRDGKTLTEIIEANGADLEEILAQVVAAETERINQAVTDGTLERAEADEMLASLEAQIKEMLEQPLQFGGRGASGDGPRQP